MDTEKPHNEEEYWVVANAWNQAANRHADRDERRLGEIGMLARETIFRLRGLEALMPDYDADKDERIQRENKIKLGALLADAVEAGGHKTLRRTADAVKKLDAERPHPDLSPDGLSKKQWDGIMDKLELRGKLPRKKREHGHGGPQNKGD